MTSSSVALPQRYEVNGVAILCYVVVSWHHDLGQASRNDAAYNLSRLETGELKFGRGR